MFKEQIIQLLQQSGYDTLTACEIASAFLQECEILPPGEYTYHVGNYSVTFCKSATN